MARAREEANCIVAAKSPRSRALRTLLRSMLPVSAVKWSVILSSMTRVLTVFAPVMPSLKLPVMRELISRISRFTRTSFFWNREKSTAMSGTMSETSAARRAFSENMTIIAPTR